MYNKCVCCLCFFLLGCATAPVTNCREQRDYSHPKVDMKVREYLKYMADFSGAKLSGDTNTTLDKPILYLKDWHFVR